MKKVCILLFLLLFTVKKSYSQKDISDSAGLFERLYFGGNFGFSVGNTSTSIALSPTVGYMISPKLSSGLGVVYQYYTYKTFSNERFTNNVYGGKIFSRYNLLPNIFAIGEIEYIHSPYYVLNPRTNRYEEKNTWTTGTFIGAGFFQRLGRGGFSFSALYNLSYDKKRSPYPEPYVFRMSFSF